MINNLGRTQDSIRAHCSTGVVVLATLTGSASVICGERVLAQHLNSKSFKTLEEAAQTVADVYAAGNRVADRVNGMTHQPPGFVDRASTGRIIMTDVFPARTPPNGFVPGS